MKFFDNFWWKLPTFIQDFLQPTANKITLKAVNNNGKWSFSKPHLLTFKETLVMNEELELLSQGSDEITLNVTTYPQDNDCLQYHFLKDCPLAEDASLYVSELTEDIIWLCGWLKWYFNDQPETLYVTIK